MKITDCKFNKPSMSNVYSHAVLYYEDGSEEWIKLPKPEYHFKGERELFDGREPLDNQNWEFVEKSSFDGQNEKDKYHKMLDKYEKYQKVN